MEGVTIKIEEDFVEYTSDIKPFVLDKWKEDEYADRIIISDMSESPDKMSLFFDLIHVEAPIANALRRVLIAELPTVAIEKIYLYQNTSCIQDEVLCHRLGLLPVYVDSTLLQFPEQPDVEQERSDEPDYIDEEPQGDPSRNIIFRLNVHCPDGETPMNIDIKPKKKGKGKIVTESTILTGNELVQDCLTGNWTLYSSAIRWEPIGDQVVAFSNDPPRIVDEDIIVAKLRPGQEIEAGCYCIKGVGRDHAKFSPVATATYRLLPDIKLTRSIGGEQAHRLKSSFSDGVIGIDESGFAYVKDPRKDTSSRNVFQHEDLKGAVEMRKIKDHFIFSVESTGALSSKRLVEDACLLLKEKAKILQDELLAQLMGNDDSDDD